MSEAASRLPSTAALVGYVEAVTNKDVLGWVWCPGKDDRLTVELRLDGQVVGTAVADQSREDLARSGIGDGRHAFSLAVPAEAGGRLADLRVFAVPVEGAPVALEPPPAPSAASDTLTPLQRGIDTLISSQRLLHRNLQAALLQQGPSAAATLAEIAAVQTKLSDAISTVELFVVRLETAFQTREHAAPPAPARRMLGAAVAISCCAFLTACWALYRSVSGG